MVKNIAGDRSPARFFSFRWVYLLSVALVWLIYLSLLFVPVDEQNWWSTTFILAMLWRGGGSPVELHLHGVFGFDLWDSDFVWGWDLDKFTSSLAIAAYVAMFLLACLIAAFTIPEAGKTKNLPATRGIPQRGLIAMALIAGMAATSFIAGAIDLLDIEINDLFGDLGWLSHGGQQPFNWGYGYYGGAYEPAWGIANPVTWISVSLGVLGFGFLFWMLMHLLKVGRDRYWQAERWTFIFTLVGLALIVMGMVTTGVDEHYGYEDLDQYLGGGYTTWSVGCFILVWAWTCRSILFMMLRRYEKATTDAENPTCFACGYDLRGLGEDSKNCPECGVAINPELLEKLRKPLPAPHAESRSTTR